MITHEKARKLVSKIEYKSLLQNDLYDYITQQEKKDERAKKVEALLELYRLEKETKEKYHTSGSLYVMQHVLDELREIAEEINLKEKELEELK